MSFQRSFEIVVRIAHEGHIGIVRTKQLLRERVWFPKIDKMVESEIKNCQMRCLTAGPSRPNPLCENPPIFRKIHGRDSQ